MFKLISKYYKTYPIEIQVFVANTTLAALLYRRRLPKPNFGWGNFIPDILFLRSNVYVTQPVPQSIASAEYTHENTKYFTSTFKKVKQT